MKVRVDFNKIYGAVNVGALEDKTRTLIEGIKRYYDKHPKHGKIDFTVFIPFFERNVTPSHDDEEKAVFRTIITNMSKHYPDSDTRKAIMESIHELNLVHSVLSVATKYNDGEDVDPVQGIVSAMDEYKSGVGAVRIPEVDDNVDHILDNLYNDEGIKWRLSCINEAMRPLRGGDFGIIAARPDQGKTSFLASELTYMAPQCEDRPILWINNEGPGFAIVPRLMQAALNTNTDGLIKLKDKGKLYTEYYEKVGGKNKIRIIDAHGMNTGQVESIIEEMRPRIVVYDMIDNIKGFKDAARTDLMLEQMYQWAREKAVEYDFIGLATSQISGEGENVLYPPLTALKDSKTGKQGACDFQLMIGSQEDKPEMASRRWLSLPKNKLRKPNSSNMMIQVVFDRDRAIYRMPVSDEVLDVKVEVDN